MQKLSRYALRVVLHQHFINFQAGDALETTRCDRFAERRHLTEVTIRRATTCVLLRKLLTHRVGGVLHGFVRLARTVQAGTKHDDQILTTAREFRHATLPVGQRQLKLAHRAGDFQGHLL